MSIRQGVKPIYCRPKSSRNWVPANPSVHSPQQPFSQHSIRRINAMSLIYSPPQALLLTKLPSAHNQIKIMSILSVDDHCLCDYKWFMCNHGDSFAYSKPHIYSKHLIRHSHLHGNDFEILGILWNAAGYLTSHPVLITMWSHFFIYISVLCNTT